MAITAWQRPADRLPSKSSNDLDAGDDVQIAPVLIPTLGLARYRLFQALECCEVSGVSFGVTMNFIYGFLFGSACFWIGYWFGYRHAKRKFIQIHNIISRSEAIIDAKGEDWP